VTLKTGKTKKLKVSGNDGEKVKWSSSDKSVVTVTKKGKLKAKAAGSAVITVCKQDGTMAAYCNVTVTDAQTENTATSADTQGASEMAKKFLKILQKYSDQVASDYQNGIKWTYSNSSAASTYKSAISKKKRKCNCALLVRWALREMKVINSKNFWGTLGGTITYRGDVKSQLEKYCEIIKVYKTPEQLLKEGNLLPGDICSYVEYQHTNVYAGNGLWYDAGRGVNYSGGVFTSFGPAAAVNMSSTTIGYIIRLK
jgi:hypothetical protein